MNWYTVTVFRQLALNCNVSLDKGQRVLVTGRLKIRGWENGERSGTTVEIEAEALGHDLAWGTTAFTRSVSAATIAPADPEATDEFPPSEDAASAPGDTPVASVEISADEAVPVPF